MSDADKKKLALDYAWDILSPIPGLDRQDAFAVYDSLTGGAATAFDKFSKEGLGGFSPEWKAMTGNK